jgi:hypothetical protein
MRAFLNLRFSLFFNFIIMLLIGTNRGKKINVYKDYFAIKFYFQQKQINSIEYFYLLYNIF